MSTKISGRTAASALTSAEQLPVVQGGLDRRTTVGEVLNTLPPAKFTSINVTVGTLAAGNITGALSFVALMSTNATPGNQTTRTGTQMRDDHGLLVNSAYKLRITNTGAGTLTLLAGVDVTVTGTATVLTNTWRDFVVSINYAAHTVVIQTIGTGTYS